MHLLPVTNTQFGFKWGPLEVIRICSDAKAGPVIMIKSGKGKAIEVRVSPSGRKIHVHGYCECGCSGFADKHGST